MPRFYEPSLWIPQKFLFANLDLHHGLLEMICADFLAGASLDSGQPDLLLQTISRLFRFLPGEQKQAFAALASQNTQ